MQEVVRRVDHVFVPVDDPAPLFELFTKTLGLPVSWDIADFGPIRSGGVSLGNCNVEFVSGSADDAPFFQSSVPLCVRGIGFEPSSFTTCLDALDERHVRHTDPYPSHHNDPAWTNVFLPGLLGNAHAIAFLCEYHKDIGMRGDDAERALTDAGGGAIGVETVDEISVGVADPDASLRLWERLLGPPQKPGKWRPGDGAAIHVRESPMDSIQGLVLKVSSLDRAKHALMERELLGPVRKRGIGLDHSKTHGLDVWLTE